VENKHALLLISTVIEGETQIFSLLTTLAALVRVESPQKKKAPQMMQRKMMAPVPL
jgi:hypothetical protein